MADAKAKADETKVDDNTPAGANPADAPGQAPGQAPDVEAAEDTGLLKLDSIGDDGHVTFKANKAAMAKVEDEVELPESKSTTLVVSSPFVDEFVGTGSDGYAYTITPSGVRVPTAVHQEIIEQAASRGIAVSTKG